MNEKRKIVIAVPLMALLVLTSLVGSVPPASAQVEIPREEIVWAGGLFIRPGSWNPFFANWGAEGWGTHFMYETLFMYNFETDELEGILGKSIKWIDEYTIEVTLREGIHWTDGAPITSEDVKFSYYLYGGFDECPWGGAYWQMGNSVGSMNNFEVVSDRVFRMHLKEEIPNSRGAWRDLITDYLIAPKHVWTEINYEYGIESDAYPTLGHNWLGDFSNDWTDPDMPEEWKVASGPYLPYYWAEDREIFIRNEDWWGNDVLGKPAPKYIGTLLFESNTGANIALDEGMIDWYGGYYPRIWECPNEYVSTWTLMEPPYFRGGPDSFGIVPNYNRYPLNEPWLHRAIAYTIDFGDLSKTASSGYLTKSNPTLLCEYFPLQAKFIDWDLVEQYEYHFNPEKAVSILEEHCIKHEGDWYTKDAPTTWRGENIEDELPDMAGRNVKLGPWKLMNVYGWTDTMIQAELITTYIYDILKIEVVSSPVDISTFESRFQDMNFDLMIHTEIGSACYPWPEVFYDLALTGMPGQWRNYMGYGNWPTFTDSEVDNLLAELDITPEGAPREAEIMNRLQEIFASELPAILYTYHAHWYAFQTKYWTNWPTEENPYMRPTPPWLTGLRGHMQKLIRNLKPTAEMVTLTVNTAPVKGEVFVDGVSWGNAPQTQLVDPGTYTVSFGVVSDYTTPSDQTVTLAAGETKTVTGTYVPPPEMASLTVDTTPVKGEVFVDGVSWGNAPQTQLVDPGTYTVSFGVVPDYTTPSDQTVTLAAGETKTVTGTYETEIPWTYIGIGIVIIVVVVLLVVKRV